MIKKIKTIFSNGTQTETVAKVDDKEISLVKRTNENEYANGTKALINIQKELNQILRELDVLSSIVNKEVLENRKNYVPVNQEAVEKNISSELDDVVKKLESLLVKENVEISNTKTDFRGNIEFLDVMPIKFDSKTALNTVQKIFEESNIEDQLDDFECEYIQHVYEKCGLSALDSKLLLELQEMNYDKLDLYAIVNNKIPSAYIKNLWFNEIILEALFELSLHDQAVILIRHNIIDLHTLAETQIIIDKILFNKECIKQTEVRKKSLYFEKTIIEMINSDVDKKIQKYNQIHSLLKVMRSSQMVEKNTLETTGKLFKVTRERVRQIEKKVLSKLEYLTQEIIRTVNKKFLLGLNDLSLAVLSLKSENDIDYFLNDIVEPTEYFANEYMLSHDYYIYNKKLLPMTNKHLFDEFMLSYDSNLHHSSEILSDFLTSLEQNGIYEKVMKNDVIDLREIEGRLSRMDNVIKTIGNKYRKHTITNSEIEDVVKNIEEMDLPNVISTSVFMEKSFIQNLDINDENELHYILKKNSHLFSVKVNFSRTPHILLSENDIVEELLLLLDEDLFQTNRDEALMELSNVTGFKLQTLLASYASKLKAAREKTTLSNIKEEELKFLLSEITDEVIHTTILKDRNKICLNGNTKDYLKNNSVNGFILRNNWLMKNKYVSIKDYVLKNVDSRGIFNEEKLGGSRFCDSYNKIRKSLRKSNIYRLNNKELIQITDEILLGKLQTFRREVKEKSKFPVSVDYLLSSDLLITILKKSDLEKYGFCNLFIEDIILSDTEIKLDGRIIICSDPIAFVDYVEGTSCTIYDYAEKFENEIGCPPPPRYINKLIDQGAYIENEIIYMNKETYLDELRSVL